MKKLTLIFILIATLLHSTPFEDRIGQLIICPIHGNKLTEEISSFIKETKIGGIILYNWADNLKDLDQLKHFINDIQQISIKSTGYPLFISIDQEGGRVQRIEMDIPSAQIMGKKGPELILNYSQRIGSKLSSLGINLNFAPVVDINSNKTNLIIKDRAFGEDPNTVVESARAFIKGLKKKNIYSCIKHFPGHGDTIDDSHYTTPISNKSLKELLDMELLPFQQLSNEIPFIMTSHIIFKEIDPENPVTLSSIFLKEILRKFFGYKNIIITDSLRMEGLYSDGQNLTELAIKAINAGNNILLIGGNRLIETDPDANFINLSQIKNLIMSLKHAKAEGRIDSNEVKNSLKKIIQYKQRIHNDLQINLTHYNS